ncbi:hypothetical protein DY000_02033868 [Brassica cretica]|uniref:Post-GPI attachment to proteins factor 3 n=1 Tax=Brassica cretica TaxID=69181 RepID=A0ABQ7DHP2_BRACR|nr:hypothetical protein DY000_02033868 [Brassica cretica]
MMTRGEERKRDGEKPTKYFGKWPLKHVYGIQEKSGKLSDKHKTPYSEVAEKNKETQLEAMEE